MVADRLRERLDEQLERELQEGIVQVGQGRQLGDGRRAQPFQRGAQHRHRRTRRQPVRRIARPGDAPVARLEGGERVGADEREPAPPLAVLDALQQDRALGATELAKGTHRCLQVTEQLPPDRHDGVLLGQQDELLQGGPQADGTRGAHGRVSPPTAAARAAAGDPKASEPVAAPSAEEPVAAPATEEPVAAPATEEPVTAGSASSQQLLAPVWQAPPTCSTRTSNASRSQSACTERTYCRWPEVSPFC